LIALFAGLCERCENQRIIESRRGSRFVLCELSRSDARFPRYPNLPVLSCAGYRPERGTSGTGEDASPAAPDPLPRGDRMSFEE
jgi:hypothetical protein